MSEGLSPCTLGEIAENLTRMDRSLADLREYFAAVENMRDLPRAVKDALIPYHRILWADVVEVKSHGNGSALDPRELLHKIAQVGIEREES